MLRTYRLLSIIPGMLAIMLLAGCGSGTPNAYTTKPATPAIPSLQTSCVTFADGYALTFTNPGNRPVEVNGFSVTLTSGSQETGSDTEPGNATITDPNTDGPTQTIGMRDWIAPGSSFTYEVQPNNGIRFADSCQLAEWTGQQ